MLESELSALPEGELLSLGDDSELELSLSPDELLDSEFSEEQLDELLDSELSEELLSLGAELLGDSELTDEDDSLDSDVTRLNWTT